jgi:hypothetical protein
LPFIQTKREAPIKMIIRVENSCWKCPLKRFEVIGFGFGSTGYPGFIYDSTGRFVYGSLTKKF